MSILPVRDALFESVAERTGLPRPFAIAAWMAIEEYARGQKGGLGLCGLTADWLAAAIGCGLPEAKSLLAAFIKAGAVVRDPDGGGSRIVRVAKTSKDPGAAVRMARMRARRKAEAEKAEQNQRRSVTTVESYVTARNAPTASASEEGGEQAMIPEQNQPLSVTERNGAVTARNVPLLRLVTVGYDAESRTEPTPKRNNGSGSPIESYKGDSESGSLLSDSESLPNKESPPNPPRKRGGGRRTQARAGCSQGGVRSRVR